MSNGTSSIPIDMEGVLRRAEEVFVCDREAALHWFNTAQVRELGELTPVQSFLKRGAPPLMRLLDPYDAGFSG